MQNEVQEKIVPALIGQIDIVTALGAPINSPCSFPRLITRNTALAYFKIVYSDRE
jgi:hypothetical protein